MRILKSIGRGQLKRILAKLSFMKMNLSTPDYDDKRTPQPNA